MHTIKEMLKNCNKIEKFILLGSYIVLLFNLVILKDNPIAFISAFCGISYTFFAGKGYPVCYLFGLTGSAFYCILSFQNSFWGNLLLYGMYYIPMQFIGFFKWNANLNTNSNVIKKIQLDKATLKYLILITIILTLVTIIILYIVGDTSPVIDGITTVFSLTGMYLTVKRCIEQWIIWIVVNALSLIMWLKIALNGTMVYGTVIMWSIYLFLAVYFYFGWKKDLHKNFSGMPEK